MNYLFGSLAITIVMTILVVFILAGLFIVLNYFVKKKALKINKLLIILLYLLYFWLVGVGVFLIGWFYQGQWVETSLADIGSWFTERIAGLIGAGITILVAFVVIKISNMILKNISNNHLENKRKQTITKITASLLKYVIWIIAFIVSLAFIGINVTGAIAGLGIIGLVIGLGAQKLINDVISGFFIVFEHHYDVGDIVEFDGFRGEVIDIGLKTTKIKNWKNEVKIIANGEISKIINFSLDLSVAAVEFGISYQLETEKVIKILDDGLKSLMDNNQNILTLPKTEGIMSFQDNKVILRVKCNTVNGQNAAVERDLRLKIKELLNEHGIEMPVQQVHIRTVSNNKE